PRIGREDRRGRNSRYTPHPHARRSSRPPESAPPHTTIITTARTAHSPNATNDVARPRPELDRPRPRRFQLFSAHGDRPLLVVDARPVEARGAVGTVHVLHHVRTIAVVRAEPATPERDVAGTADVLREASLAGEVQVVVGPAPRRGTDFAVGGQPVPALPALGGFGRLRAELAVDGIGG